MSNKTEAALTGVIYYLLEEERELAEAEEKQGFGSDAQPWPLGARSLSFGMSRLLQGRKFSSPAGNLIPGCGNQAPRPACRHADIMVKSRIMQLGLTAERRNNSRRNRSNPGS